jgi:hypothetical protein
MNLGTLVLAAVVLFMCATGNADCWFGICDWKRAGLPSSDRQAVIASRWFHPIARHNHIVTKTQLNLI